MHTINDYYLKGTSELCHLAYQNTLLCVIIESMDKLIFLFNLEDLLGQGLKPFFFYLFLFKFTFSTVDNIT